MTPKFSKLLSSATDHEGRIHLLIDFLNDVDLAEILKTMAVQERLRNLEIALGIIDIVSGQAKITGDLKNKGYALWARAVVRSLELGEYQEALELYAEAIDIFQKLEDEVSVAYMQLSQIWSLSNLGHHDEAFNVGEIASATLEKYQLWADLAILKMNLASIYTRMGEYLPTLKMYDECLQVFDALEGELDHEAKSITATVIQNRAISLCYLGRFEESLSANQQALEAHLELDNFVESARVREFRGVTFFMLGRFNEALKFLNQARNVFSTNKQKRHGARVDLYICECLFQLRRFREAIEKVEKAEAVFNEFEAIHELGIAKLYKAVGFMGLGQFDDAEKYIDEARSKFYEEGNDVWVVYSDLEKAIILQKHGRFQECMKVARDCIDSFKEHELVFKQAEASLILAQAAKGLNDHETMQKMIDQVQIVGTETGISWFVYQAQYLQGSLLKSVGQLSAAKAAYEKAINALERMRGHLMIEFRVSFQEDKQELYEEMVELCITIDQPKQAFTYAERSKSRALVDLLSFRLNLKLEARNPEDQPLVEKILALREERDQLYRHWDSKIALLERGGEAFSGDLKNQAKLSELENEISNLWHTLLVQNAEEYAHQAALWQVRSEPVEPYLGEDCVLVEYFTIKGQLIVFLVSQDQTIALKLDAQIDEIKKLGERFNQNIRYIPYTSVHQMPTMTRKAQILLNRLFKLLIQPLVEHLDGFRKLIFVPHSILHYLPLHALHNGEKYLVEEYDISFLPSASILHYCHEREPVQGNVISLGYSANGQLPYTLDEAQAVAHIFGTQAIIGEKATRNLFDNQVSDYQIMHLATHAEYHDDKPLFSGLMLSDGWLTTLDIFNLKLKTALVTLSACKTGRSVLGGGDELLGLMRAFLYAGTQSLALSLWAVEDRSTAEFMQNFYHSLAQGQAKDTALCQTQRQFIQGQVRKGEEADARYLHPYFWAPFILVGDATPLTL